MTIPKFRAWDKREQRMIESYDILAIDYENEEIVTQKIYSERGLSIERDIHSYDFDDVNLMQSTGLFDKNGKEVFENDVIRDSDGFEGIVQYDESYGMYGIAYLPTLPNGIDMTFEELKDNFRNKFEVIGNIWENKEFLEEEK